MRRRRRRPGPEPAPRDQTRARRSVESGGRCGVVISRITTRPPAARRARARRALIEVREVPHPEADRRRVELVGRVAAAASRWLARSGPRAAAAPAPPPCAARPRASARRSRLRRPRRRADLLASSNARSPVPVATSSARPPGPAAPARPRDGATRGAGLRSSPNSGGRRRRRCGRTSPVPAVRRACPRRVAAGRRSGAEDARRRSRARRAAPATEASRGTDQVRELLRGLRHVRERRHRRGRVLQRHAIAPGEAIEPMWVSGGPGPLLPFSPIT